MLLFDDDDDEGGKSLANALRPGLAAVTVFVMVLLIMPAWLPNIEHFLACVNSYLGLMKHHAAYRIIRRLVDEVVSRKWLRFVRFDEDRLCFQAVPGYTHNEILQRKYNFKLHNHGKARAIKRAGVPAA